MVQSALKESLQQVQWKAGSSNGDIPNAEQDILELNVECREKTQQRGKWLSDLKEKMVKKVQQNVVINEGKVKKQCSEMPNWKAPGYDGVLDKKT